jgi:hypothetical protein
MCPAGVFGRFGLLIGVPEVYLSGEALRGFLIGVSPCDVWTLGAVVMGLILIALLACLSGRPPRYAYRTGSPAPRRRLAGVYWEQRDGLQPRVDFLISSSV